MDRVDHAQGERGCIADDHLVDFIAQVCFWCAAGGFDAGTDGDDPSKILPPDRFELHEGWPPVNRREWRTFARQMLTLLSDRRAYLVKARVAEATESVATSSPNFRNAG